MKWLQMIVGAAALTWLCAASAVIPVRAEDAAFDPANFSTPLAIDHPYFPLDPGASFVYQGALAGKAFRERFVVTGRTKTVLGVNTREVHHRSWEGGRLVEATLEWFAQDDAGNVWFFGEHSTQFQNGKVTGYEGSWQAGVDGALPGIVMPANPQVGDTYRQENAPGLAEDMATVLSRGGAACAGDGCFFHVLQTKDFAPSEPGVVEHKYYVPGIGLIKTVLVEGGSEVSELVSRSRNREVPTLW